MTQKNVRMKGHFYLLPDKKAWQLRSDEGDCYLIQNPSKIPADTFADFKVVAVFDSVDRSLIRIVKVKPLIEEGEDLPDFGTAF